MRVATVVRVALVGSVLLISLSIVFVFLVRRAWRVKHPEMVEAEDNKLYGLYYMGNVPIEGTAEVMDTNNYYKSI